MLDVCRHELLKMGHFKSGKVSQNLEANFSVCIFTMKIGAKGSRTFDDVVAFFTHQNIL